MGDAERRLWRAVLGQAYEDAEMSAIGEETGAEPLDATRARRYLRADSSFEAANLELVCEFADVPADRVFLWARQRYPLEQKVEKPMECDDPAAAFTNGPLLRSKKREQGSRTPQIAA